MDSLRSTSTSSRGRTNRRGERGYVLITAIVLAVMYFALMELMLVDSQRALKESQRFRSKVIATVAAENAVELAAAQMAKRAGSNVTAEDEQAAMEGTLSVSGSAPSQNFEIKGNAKTKGVAPTQADVRVQGRMLGDPMSGPLKIVIDYSFHSQ
jgi:ABC-type Na+ efflux pump permease subunit